ncbi:hypothetical protein KKB06_04295 [Patescibacteria group bacterium]|nr:hypothetical protein [Patescibacteria group bacterium]
MFPEKLLQIHQVEMIQLADLLNTATEKIYQHFNLQANQNIYFLQAKREELEFYRVLVNTTKEGEKETCKVYDQEGNHYEGDFIFGTRITTLPFANRQ